MARISSGCGRREFSCKRVLYQVVDMFQSWGMVTRGRNGTPTIATPGRDNGRANLRIPALQHPHAGATARRIARNGNGQCRADEEPPGYPENPRCNWRNSGCPLLRQHVEWVRQKTGEPCRWRRHRYREQATVGHGAGDRRLRHFLRPNPHTQRFSQGTAHPVSAKW